MSSMIFNPIAHALGSNWSKLAPAIRMHYSSDKKMTLKGTMDEVWHSKIAGFFIFFSRFLGALVPFTGSNVPTITHNWLSEDNLKYFFRREFHFEKKRPLTFSSHMEYYKKDEIIEYVKFGVGIRMKLTVEDGTLVYTIIDYIQDLKYFKIHIPSVLLLGGGHIIEKQINANTIRVEFELTHPIFGKTFTYSGNFKT